MCELYLSLYVVLHGEHSSVCERHERILVVLDGQRVYCECVYAFNEIHSDFTQCMSDSDTEYMYAMLMNIEIRQTLQSERVEETRRKICFVLRLLLHESKSQVHGIALATRLYCCCCCCCFFWL